MYKHRFLRPLIMHCHICVNGICHHVGQKENQTGIRPLHMGQTKTRNIDTFANNGCWQDRYSLRIKMQILGYIRFWIDENDMLISIIYKRSG
jgi:hypothetical protein